MLTTVTHPEAGAIRLTPFHAFVGPAMFGSDLPKRLIWDADGVQYGEYHQYIPLRGVLYETDPSGLTLAIVMSPEKGLHPHKIGPFVQGLRTRWSPDVQVIIRTESPLVVNELQPEEVSIVTRSADGKLRVTRMDDTINFASRSKVYALGELWLAYGDGDCERGLVGDP